LLDSGTHTKKALSQLLDIYQQEQDWDKAIACARAIATRCKEDMSLMTAQFYCEWAQQCELQGQRAEAVRLLQLGLEADPGCARASLMEGRIAKASGDTRAAVTAFKRIEHQDPSVLVQALPHLLECHRNLGQSDEFIAYLRRLVAKNFGVQILLMLVDLIAEQRGIEPAAFLTRIEPNAQVFKRTRRGLVRATGGGAQRLRRPLVTSAVELPMSALRVFGEDPPLAVPDL
jgi:lipopolysaccharide biosynthesis regulator YciM